jgi:3-oxoadipate enol-lactonase
VPEFQHEGWTLQFNDEGEGPPVLLIHGLLFDSRQFEPQVRALRDRYRVITPDCRNHGRSEFREADYTQWDLMEDQIALLDHLGIERAIWGGVSMGGFQSLRAALRHPERVAALIMIDSQAGPEAPEAAPMYESAAEVAKASGWNPDISQLAGAMLFGASASDKVKRPWLEWWESQPTSSAPSLIQAVTRRDDVTERLREIDVPAVVIHGEEDVAIEMHRAEALADGLPNLIEFVRVPRGGHSSTLEQPDVVTAAVERFLDKVAPSVG